MSYIASACSVPAADASLVTYGIAEKQGSIASGRWSQRQLAFLSERMYLYYSGPRMLQSGHSAFVDGSAQWKRKLKVTSIRFDAEKYAAPDCNSEAFDEKKLYIVHIIGVERPLSAHRDRGYHKKTDSGNGTNLVFDAGEAHIASTASGAAENGYTAAGMGLGGAAQQVRDAIPAPLQRKRFKWTFRARDYDELVGFFSSIRGKLVASGKLASQRHGLPASDPRNGLQLLALPLNLKGSLGKFSDAVFYFMQRGNVLNGVSLSSVELSKAISEHKKDCETANLNVAAASFVAPKQGNGALAKPSNAIANAVSQAWKKASGRFKNNERSPFVIRQKCYLTVTHDHILCVNHDRHKSAALTAVRAIALVNVDAVVYSTLAIAEDAVRMGNAEGSLEPSQVNGGVLVEPFILITSKNKSDAQIIFTALPNWIPTCWRGPPYNISERDFNAGDTIALLRDRLFVLFEEINATSRGQVDIPGFVDVNREGDALPEGTSIGTWTSNPAHPQQPLSGGPVTMTSIGYRPALSDTSSASSSYATKISAVRYLRDTKLLQSIKWFSPLYGIDAVIYERGADTSIRHTVMLEHKPSLSERLHVRDGALADAQVSGSRLSGVSNPLGKIAPSEARDIPAAVDIDDDVSGRGQYLTAFQAGRGRSLHRRSMSMESASSPLTDTLCASPVHMRDKSAMSDAEFDDSVVAAPTAVVEIEDDLFTDDELFLRNDKDDDLSDADVRRELEDSFSEEFDDSLVSPNYSAKERREPGVDSSSAHAGRSPGFLMAEGGDGSSETPFTSSSVSVSASDSDDGDELPYRADGNEDSDLEIEDPPLNSALMNRWRVPGQRGM